MGWGAVEWDEVNSRWLQYYQLKNVPGYVGQVTLIATAPRILKENLTPETWTPLGIAFAENYTFNAGSGDSTYVKTYRFDKRWEAHSLYGGGSTRRAHWTSPDGINWTLNPNIMEFQQHLIDHLPGFNYGMEKAKSPAPPPSSLQKGNKQPLKAEQLFE